MEPKRVLGLIILLLPVIFCVFPLFSQEQKERLAVAPFEVSGIDDVSVGSVVADLILSRLSDKFELYERTLLKKLLEEKNLQDSDLSAAKPNAVEAIRLEGVRLLVVGQVARLGEKVIVTARVVDCKTAMVLSKGDIDSESLDALPDKIDELLSKLRLKDGSLIEKSGSFVPNEKGEIGRWKELSIENAPSARTAFTMVRCGDFVVVWGGSGEKGFLSDGARFDVKERKWLPMSTKGAPCPRAYHTAVWTGRYLIVWGGTKAEKVYCNDGAKYDPTSDTWEPIKVPSFLKARCLHSAVWTGKCMLVWGGKGEEFYRDGALYDPENDMWLSLPLNGTPPRERVDFAYGMCGKYFIVWGGVDKDSNYLNTGAVFDTEKMEWRKITDASAPLARRYPIFCETPKGLLVIGGEFNPKTPQSRPSLEPAIYNPQTDTWTPLEYDSSRVKSYSVGSSLTLCANDTLIMWGGMVSADQTTSNGYGWKLGASNKWYPIRTENSPSARSGHKAVWCDKYLLIWGGWTKTENKIIRLGNGAILEP
jgi:TolB-like protein